MKFMRKHLTAIIVTLVCLVLIVLAGFAVYSMFYPNNDKDIYGDRGAGAPVLTDEFISQLKTDINETGDVNSVEFVLSQSATTIKFFIDVKEDVKIADAKKIGELLVESLSADMIEFYDLSINVTQKNGEMKEYPAVGQKAKGSKTIYWVVNKEVSSGEE